MEFFLMLPSGPLFVEKRCPHWITKKPPVGRFFGNTLPVVPIRRDVSIPACLGENVIRDQTLFLLKAEPTRNAFGVRRE